jgi:hypothetical protein
MEAFIELHELAEAQYKVGDTDLLDVHHKHLGHAASLELNIPLAEKHNSADKVANEVIQHVYRMHSFSPERISHGMSA